jgi:D-3-phosphoglycerate dehydrogenase
MNQEKIFVADDVSDSGLQPLRDAGMLVEKRVGLPADQLINALEGSSGLIVRSETKVTAQLLEGAPSLRVIGRAGVGVDNIDVPAATVRGVVVMNAPDGNTITTAEHTIAMLVALARRIPQANSSLKAGRWNERNSLASSSRGRHWESSVLVALAAWSPDAHARSACRSLRTIHSSRRSRQMIWRSSWARLKMFTAAPIS